MAGRVVEQPFRSRPSLLAVTVSQTGLGAEQARTRAPPIQLLSQWAAPSRKQLLLLITDNSAGAQVERVPMDRGTPIHLPFRRGGRSSGFVRSTKVPERKPPKGGTPNQPAKGITG